MPSNPDHSGAVGQPDAILIAGPTASGKSALAMAMAGTIASSGGRALIVNADSMQVYQELRSITARPSKRDEAAHEHRLYGFVPASTGFSAAAWLTEARRHIGEAVAEGKVPIVVGGTGLYFKVLEQGIGEVPPIPSDTRSRIRSAIAKDGPAVMHNRLDALDPEAAAMISPGDRQRISRALEVVEATGRSIVEWNRQSTQGGLPAGTRCEKIVLDPPRPLLHQRIVRRFDQMLEEGAIDEVRSVLSLGLDPTLPVMKAIGVAQIAAYLEGSITLEEAAIRATAASRRYAKRQLTWFRNQMGPEWIRRGATPDLVL